MVKVVVGLDVGTHAVRAAEVVLGKGQPTLRRFAQVTLPPGAVVDGEVVDPSAVSLALKRLWKEGGFKSRTVVTGVANPRVLVRSTEVPVMAVEDLRSALTFQVQDLIPIPIEDTVFDYQIIEETGNDEGQRLYRVMLVAAHRDMLRSLLAALEGAGLTPSGIDLLPFALLRSLVGPGSFLPPLPALSEDRLAKPEEGEHGEGDTEEEASEPYEAIVSIGAGVTTVMLHQAGKARFVRSVASGGNDITEKLAHELSIDFEQAEGLKREARLDSDDAMETRAAEIVAEATTELFDEVRDSLDYFRTQISSGTFNKVMITGGVAMASDIESKMANELGNGYSVFLGHPLEHVAIGRTGLSPEVLTANEPLIATPMGLALNSVLSLSGLAPISLLPGEVTAERRDRQQTLVAAGAVAGVAVLLAGVYAMRMETVDNAKNDAAIEESQTAQLQAEVDTYQDVEALQADVTARESVVKAVLVDDLAWTRMFQEIATVLPGDVWLTSFNATGAPPTVAGAASPIAGNITVGAIGFYQTSTARWLLRLGELESLRDLWVPSATKPPDGLENSLVTFSSSATLTEKARSNRSDRYINGEEGQ
ncbi:MAG: type IV pilus assembly protein PilM [Acidimicrobiales bacterium]